MDQEEYERRLQEVCEYTQVPVSARTGQPLKKTRNRTVSEPPENNATLPFTVTKVKTRPSVCDLCGKICRDGQNYERRLLHRNGFDAWRYNCTVCKLVEDPWSGQMIHTFASAQGAWGEYIRTCKSLHEDLKKAGK